MRVEIKELVYKLHERAAKCHREVGEIDSARERIEVRCMILKV